MAPDHGQRLALVTGATGSIGGAIVDGLLERGMSVTAVGRSEAELSALGRRSHVTPVSWDMALQTAVPDELADLGRLDVLVHAAGVADVVSIESTPSSAWTSVFEVNVASAARLTAAALPGLRAAQGHIIFLNSSPGLSAVPRWSGYLATKAALREFADVLREEEAERGVKVTTVSPSGTATDLLRKVRQAFGTSYDPDRLITPASTAALILSVLDHPRDAYALELSIGRIDP